MLSIECGKEFIYNKSFMFRHVFLPKNIYFIFGLQKITNFIFMVPCIMTLY